MRLKPPPEQDGTNIRWALLTVKSRHSQCSARCPLCANSCHQPALSNHLVGALDTEPRQSDSGHCLPREVIMILDWHSHIYTPEEAADDQRTFDGNSGPSWGERGCPMVLENFVRAHKENNIDISVVTNAAHYLKGKRTEEELSSVQAWSDYAAKVQQDYKGILYSFATILPCGGAAFIKPRSIGFYPCGLQNFARSGARSFDLIRPRRSDPICCAGASPIESRRTITVGSIRPPSGCSGSLWRSTPKRRARSCPRRFSFDGAVNTISLVGLHAPNVHYGIFRRRLD